MTFAKNFGQGRIETYDGVDVNVSARLRAGLTMQGGVNVGRSTLNDCDIYAQLPETQTGFVRTPAAFCDQSSGWLTTIGGLATYVVPKADVQVAATIQSRPFAGANFPGIASQSLAANWLVFNAQISSRARAAVVGRRRPDHGQRGRAGHVLRRPAQPGGFPRVEDPQVRESAGERRRRSLQPVQYQRRVCVFPDAQHGDSRDVSAAGLARLGAIREGERADRLLSCQSGRPLSSVASGDLRWEARRGLSSVGVASERCACRLIESESSPCDCT